MTDSSNLEGLAKLIRYYILQMTTVAGSGHPTSSLSATDLMTALFFGKLRFDLGDIQNPNNDRVIFSKGHVSPLIYALYTVAGAIEEEDLLNYRKFGSELEGHPTLRFKFAEAATGSLGQGLSVGVGEALAIRQGTRNRKQETGGLPLVYVLMGDGECAEGSVWEACEIASYYKLGNLVAIVDVNRLGQSGETMLGWKTEVYADRFKAFGWEVKVVNGHDYDKIVKAYEGIDGKGDKPIAIIAKTIKGKGVSFLENKEGWHGKALSQEDFEKAVGELGDFDKLKREGVEKPIEGPVSSFPPRTATLALKYKTGEEVATRKAFGEALASLGKENSRIVSLDGETSNSTFAEIFRNKFPERYFEMFIAEQNMVGVALGMSKRGYVPFVSTFSAFFTRAFDQIRMSVYSGANVKFVGSHSGVSIGEDGPSQMGLEDISMFKSLLGSTVFCPSDAVSCSRLVELAAAEEGIFYIRTARPATPVIYKSDEDFWVGGSKTLKQSEKDSLVIVACGVTVGEALKAHEILKKEGINVAVLDCYSIKPIDEETLKAVAAKSNNIVITVEDHYFEGGLGDSVLNVFAPGGTQVHKLAVVQMPMSGKGEELMDFEGISAVGIVKKVKEVTNCK